MNNTEWQNRMADQKRCDDARNATRGRAPVSAQLRGLRVEDGERFAAGLLKPENLPKVPPRRP